MQDNFPGIVMMIVGMAAIIFRERFARSTIKSQNDFWGTHYGEEDIKNSARSTIPIGLILVAWGAVIAFNIPVSMYVDASLEYFLSALVFIIIGVAGLFFRDKSDRDHIHFNGKPAIVRIGKWSTDLHTFIVTIFCIGGIIGGISMVLSGIGWR